MGFSYLRAIVLFFVSWIVYANVHNWWKFRQLRKWGKQYGCAEVPAVPNEWPWGVERLYTLFTQMKYLDFLDDFVVKRCKDMGCYTYRMHNIFFTSVVFTYEPENIQAVLATKFHDYELGPARNDAFHSLLGNGIFTAEREQWAHFRHQLKPQFTRDQVSDLESAERHINVLFKAMPETNTAGWVESADWMPLLYRFTLDASTEFLFGQSVNSQSSALHAQDSGYSAEEQANIAFADAMSKAQEHVVSCLRVARPKWWPVPKGHSEACDIVKGLADQFVRSALQKNENEKKKKPQGKVGESEDGEKKKFVLLDALVAETRDPIELRDQALHVLLAGRDTTSALLGWSILLLSRHPEIYASLRSIIISVFGTSSNPLAEPSFASLKACKELTHLLYEVLRLYPLVPINGRLAIRDTVLPTGSGKDGKQPVAVMKGEQVGYHSYVMHRRQDIWGEDADVFRPSRWEGRKLGWEMNAFSGGPRVCLGQQYALNEASFFIVRVLQRFDKIEALDMIGLLKKGLTITLQPGDGVKVRMHRASE
ncbi:related to n-alkane-inducible cytochrome P450 [Rhynchosporium agropyri]|uniref:Related to n-alkane-inducible cytochrome P450 n=1 Tax=Rhynchosporium agropyri TaxID=914238 RepID=A0A1E1KQX2_9HELO|nr:related to n-alkane-inducible cytochrome P450 [Rhynchosporium agropyri]